MIAHAFPQHHAHLSMSVYEILIILMVTAISFIFLYIALLRR
jgi:hypothetical protein